MEINKLLKLTKQISCINARLSLYRNRPVKNDEHDNEDDNDAEYHFGRKERSNIGVVLSRSISNKGC